MRNISTVLLCVLFTTNLFAQDFSKLVNPFIGTGGHGHTFPGATAPFGMVQVSPDTRLEGWDGCSGYHYSDSVIYGFSHTHLSGTGCSDYGDVMIMPMMGEPHFDAKIYASKFSHVNEKAHAGFYSVHLDDEDIDVELTTTTRVAIHQYTFHKTGKASFILDLLHRDKLLDGKIRIVDDHTIEGFRRSQAWADNQRLYFRIEFMKSFIDKKIIEKDLPADNGLAGQAGSQQTQAAFSFNVKQGEKLLVKVSLSAVDYEGAKNNMETEAPIWAFEKTQQFTEALWNNELGKINVKGGTSNERIIFYTALYHTFIQPNTYSDVDGRYLGRDMQIHKTDNCTYYTVFSLWDTFRAAHPLYNIVQRKRNLDCIKTFLLQYQQGGRLPVWELSSNETDCMIGYHSVPVIADAYAKGIRDFDLKLAVEAMKKSATWNHYGLPIYMKQGYLSSDDEHESVSKSLEYAYDDWCISKFCEGGDKIFFDKRAQSWKHLFDEQTGFMRARKNGGWYTPFEPSEVNNNYTEANSWQYSFFVPHDIPALIKMHGGEMNFEKKLDDLFTASSKTSGREQADITGLIGQYAHGNEPSHHMAYLYNYVGKASKTQMRVHQILNEMYKNAPDGLAGNEDCGQMSAWYVMSAMGLYAVCPGSDEYQITSPLFDEITIKTDDNKFVIINAKHQTDKDIFVKNLKVNGTTQKFTTLHHNEIFGNEKTKPVTEINFTLSSTPDDKALQSGAEINELLKSTIPVQIVQAPVISARKQTFEDSLLIIIQPLQKNEEVFYTTDRNDKLARFSKYTKPFYIQHSTQITAYAVDANKSYSTYTTGLFHQKENHWTVKLNCHYSKQYTAGGDDGIIDGLYGNTNWRKGNWQGFQAEDFDAIIDLKEEKTIEHLGANYLQDTRAWIVFPKNVEFYISENGTDFTSVGKVENNIPVNDLTPQTKSFNVTLTQKPKARFIKVHAETFGKLPEWHQGAGGEAHIFVDEVEVK